MKSNNRREIERNEDEADEVEDVNGEVGFDDAMQ